MLRHALIGILALAMTGFASTARAHVAPIEGKTWTPKPGDVVKFDVLRKGQPFGTHIVRFEQNSAGDLVVRTDVSLKAGLGPVTLFRYTLSATETWRDGELVALTGWVNDDGRKGNVAAERAGGQLIVNGTKFSGRAPPGILPTSHWNYKQTRASQLLSTEDGEVINVTVTRQGTERIIAGGKTVTADRYRLDSNIDVDLWYDSEGRWLKLAFEARGQSIEYVLRNSY